MNCTFKYRIVLIIILLIVKVPLQCMFPINIFRAFDINLRPPIWHDTKLQVTGWFENSLHVQGFNGLGHKVNPLQIWTEKQDALAMLKGFPATNPISIFLDDVLGDPTDDGIRGNFIPTGKSRVRGGGISLRYHAKHNFTLVAHLPFYAIDIHDVLYKDLTQDTTVVDRLVKQELTSVLAERIGQFDPNLDIYGWKKIGFGDLIIGVDWLRNFVQAKPLLKEVALNARCNISIPTGIKKDEDVNLSFPFGFDGSVGLIFGGGIDLSWLDHIKGGIDVEFIYLFGNTRLRRIKTDPAQTDFFLLAKVEAHKDFGFTQRFNLYAQAYKIWRGLSLTATYQYWKHGDDNLALLTNQYSDAIANTAESLQEWILHNAIFSISYDCQDDIADVRFLKPQVSAFYKVGFNGSRALLINSIGGTVSFSF